VAARWRPQEDASLRRWYAADVPVVEIGQRLGRSAHAVDARRRALGIKARRPATRRWSRTQDSFIAAAAAAGLPAQVVADRLALPLESVRRRRRTLLPGRPSPRRYGTHEDAALRAAIAEGRPITELAATMGRTPNALRMRARSLGLLGGAPRRRWTPHEDRSVRDGYGRGLSCDAIANDVLHGARSAGAVSARARKLGLASFARAWTADDDAALRRGASAGLSVHALATRFTRTPEAIRRRARKLELQVAEDPVPAGGRRWTRREDVLLAELQGLNPARVASELGRSDRAIRRRMARLGLSHSSPHHLVPSRGSLSPGEVRVLLREYTSGDPRRLLALARRLNRPPVELRRLACRLLEAHPARHSERWHEAPGSREYRSPDLPPSRRDPPHA